MPESPERDPLITVVESALHVARRLDSRKFDDPLITPLTPVERLVLQHIDRHPQTSPSELADRLNLQKSNASAAVRRLVDLGLIERSHDDHDGRRTLLSATGKAATNLQRVHAEWSRAMSGIDVDHDDVAATVRVLSAVDDWLAAQ